MPRDAPVITATCGGAWWGWVLFGLGFDVVSNVVAARRRSRLTEPVCLLPRDCAHYAATVELRQLRYFVTVAEELNFGRAVERLRIAGPSPSQQIKALSDLKVQLSDRDRRSVALTAAGAALLPGARNPIQQADELRRSATGMAATEPVRVGWCESGVRVILRSARPGRRSCGGHLGDAVAHPGGPRRRRKFDLAICWCRPAT